MMKDFPGASQTFDFQDQEDFARLHDRLVQVGYLDPGLLEALGLKDFSGIKCDDHGVLLERINTDSALHTLVRLFLMEQTVEKTRVERALLPLTISSLVNAGLVFCRADGIRAAVKLLPFQGLALAFDLTAFMETDLRENYVMGVGASTITLSNLTIRRPSRQTLDLGAGCGVQAFLASQHSDHTIAVDINPRANQLSRFNAKLNQLPTVECLQGDFFGPVAGQTFDLVVSNPPFVISPETRFIYRDGGLEADSVTRRIVQTVPGYLNEGGYCQILCNWAQIKGRPWQDRLAEWFDKTGCDAWVMRSESLAADIYASTWIRHTEFFDREMEFKDRLHKWMAYYQNLDIESVGAGLITMRKSSARQNWFRADESPEKMVGPCGECVQKGFERKDFLETVQDDQVLLNSRLCLSPDIRLEQQFEPGDGQWKPNKTLISLARGFVYKGSTDPLMANLIIKCNGKRLLKELLPDIAHTLGAPLEQMTPAICRLIRKFIEQGFLLPDTQ